MVSALSGKAVVHVVSTNLAEHYSFAPGSDSYPYGDTRELADGLGRDRVTGEAAANTGGKWLLLADSGAIDFTSLGISDYIVVGRRLRFDYTIGSGETIYVHVLVDYNLDGTCDTEWYGTLTVSASSAVFNKITEVPIPAPPGIKN